MKFFCSFSLLLLTLTSTVVCDNGIGESTPNADEDDTAVETLLEYFGRLTGQIDTVVKALRRLSFAKSTQTEIVVYFELPTSASIFARSSASPNAAKGDGSDSHRSATTTVTRTPLIKIVDNGNRPSMFAYHGRVLFDKKLRAFVACTDFECASAHSYVLENETAERLLLLAHKTDCKRLQNLKAKVFLASIDLESVSLLDTVKIGEVDAALFCGGVKSSNKNTLFHISTVDVGFINITPKQHVQSMSSPKQTVPKRIVDVQPASPLPHSKNDQFKQQKHALSDDFAAPAAKHHRSTQNVENCDKKEAAKTQSSPAKYSMRNIFPWLKKKPDKKAKVV